ncbi:MAG: nuclear transport factor 2 family protein, partial [Nevskiaceae bacterium]
PGAARAQAGSAAGDTPQAQPSSVVDTFHDALKAGDRRRALEQLTGDVVIFEQGRMDRSRTDYARKHLAEDIGFASVTELTVTRRSVKIHGAVAWVTSVNRTRGQFRNQSVDFATDETMILTYTGGRWRIAHVHWSFDNRSIH